MSDSFVREPARLERRWLTAAIVALIAALALALGAAPALAGSPSTAPAPVEPAKPVLTKTAHGKWVQKIDWDIVKKLRVKNGEYADRQNWQIFWGDSVWANYVIGLEKTVENKYSVYGTITIPLDRPQSDAVRGPIAIKDVITFKNGKQMDIPADKLSCDGYGEVPTTIAYGGELVCHYSVYLERPASGYNTVQVWLGPEKRLMTARAEFKFGDAPDYVRGHDKVWVHDSNFPGDAIRGPFDGSKRLAYKKHFECNGKQNPFWHTNVAKLLVPATLDSSNAIYSDANGKYSAIAKDTATLHLECFGLRVKTEANGEFKRLIRWKIAKYANVDRIDLTNTKGGSTKDSTSAIVKYGVKVDSYADDIGFAASGKIAITNKHPRRAAEIVDINDLIIKEGGDPMHARVWCNGGGKAGALHLPITIAPGETLTCYWHSRLDDGSERKNIAEVELQNFHREIGAKTERTGTTWFRGYAPIKFGKPWKLIDETVGVYDTLAPKDFLGRLHFKETPKVFRYDVHVRPGDLAPECGKGSLRNVAWLKPADTQIEYEARVTIPVFVTCVDAKPVLPKHDPKPLPKPIDDKKDPAPSDDKKVDPDPTDDVIVCLPSKRKPWHLLGPDGKKGEFFKSGKTYQRIMRMGSRGKSPHYRLARGYAIAKLYALAGAEYDEKVGRSMRWAERYFASHGGSVKKHVSAENARKLRKAIQKKKRVLVKYARHAKMPRCHYA